MGGWGISSVTPRRLGSGEIAGTRGHATKLWVRSAQLPPSAYRRASCSVLHGPPGDAALQVHDQKASASWSMDALFSVLETCAGQIHMCSENGGEKTNVSIWHTAQRVVDDVSCMHALPRAS